MATYLYKGEYRNVSQIASLMGMNSASLRVRILRMGFEAAIAKGVPFKYSPGMKFNRLTLIRHHSGAPSGKWVCRCDCGKTAIANANDMKRGKVKSCGCVLVEFLQELNGRDEQKRQLAEIGDES